MCTVQCSICSVKFTGANAGASIGSGELGSVQCAVSSVWCAVSSVQCSDCYRQRIITSNLISLIKKILLILGFQNRKVLNCLTKLH